MATTDTLEEVPLPSVTVQVFGPVAVDGLGLIEVQLSDQPPKLTPDSVGAVKVTVVGAPLVVLGYVAVQTEPPGAACSVEPPQWITSGVPVAEGAVTSQLEGKLPMFKPTP
jgi:hypothetical protein